MPKSRNRKNHKKKVAARKNKLQQQQNIYNKKVEELQKEYIDKLDKKAEEEKGYAGEVPLTL